MWHFNGTDSWRHNSYLFDPCLTRQNQSFPGFLRILIVEELVGFNDQQGIISVSEPGSSLICSFIHSLSV